MRRVPRRIDVDVIVPVHKAAATIEDTVRSAMCQSIPEHLREDLRAYAMNVSVCCYDDGSTDQSWTILQKLREELSNDKPNNSSSNEVDSIPSTLLIQKSADGVARGAGYARNKAIELHPAVQTSDQCHHFLCLLDSDDTMHTSRVAEQTHFMLQMDSDERDRTIVGCNFDRDPPDSTWHYSRWANTLSQERLLLERFREVTILQPTWFLPRKRWSDLGGYVEAPAPNSETSLSDWIDEECKSHQRLVHPRFDTAATLRLAEDLRFFHDHIRADGLVRRKDTKTPLVTYRHSGDNSQSFRTSRKLLWQLRVLAFERSVLRTHLPWNGGQDEGQFVIWGAGRDGKDFVKTLREDTRKRVYCFVDVDEKKMTGGGYVNRELGVQIPIVHYSFLARDEEVRSRIHKAWVEGTLMDDEKFGRINKGNPNDGTETKDSTTASPSLETKDMPPRKKQRTSTQRSTKLDAQGLDKAKLQRLPVVVCVAMYRTNGALERNVQSIGREEGTDLWHFS